MLDHVDAIEAVARLADVGEEQQVGVTGEALRSDGGLVDVLLRKLDQVSEPEIL